MIKNLDGQICNLARVGHVSVDLVEEGLGAGFVHQILDPVEQERGFILQIALGATQLRPPVYDFVSLHATPFLECGAFALDSSLLCTRLLERVLRLRLGNADFATGSSGRAVGIRSRIAALRCVLSPGVTHVHALPDGTRTKGLTV
jgi:hypothetical protein